MVYALSALLPFIPFAVIALVAQWSDRHRVMRWVTFGLLLAFDALVALGGLFALLVGLMPQFQRLIAVAQPGLTAAAWNVFGLILLGTALLAPVLLLPAVRRLLARLIPIDAESSIHATALVLAVLVMGLNLSQVPLIGGLAYEAIKLSGKFAKSWLIKPFIFPGLMMQKITTSEPDDEQLTVSMAALKAVLTPDADDFKDRTYFDIPGGQAVEEEGATA